MVKVYCDKCGKELSRWEISYCNEVVGYGHFCREHFPEKCGATYSSPVLLTSSKVPFDEKFLERWKKAVENFKTTP